MTLLETMPAVPDARPRSIRVLVLSSERIFSDAVVARFRHEADLNAVGFVYTTKDVSEPLRDLRPEVLVVDAAAEVATLADLIRAARDRDRAVAIVALVAESETKSITQLVALGITSCVLKSSPITELVTAVRFAAQGSGWMSPALLPQLFIELQRPSPTAGNDRLASLTAREREILSLMVDGCGQAAIAKQLCLAFTTIRTHTRNLLDKLGVHSSTAAVSVALASGFRPNF